MVLCDDLLDVAMVYVLPFTLQDIPSFYDNLLGKPLCLIVCTKFWADPDKFSDGLPWAAVSVPIKEMAPGISGLNINSIYSFLYAALHQWSVVLH